MKPDEILDAMEHIDAELIEAAGQAPRRSSMPGVIAALAAMLALLISVAFALGNSSDGPVQMGSQPGTSGFHPTSGTSSFPHSAPSSMPTTPPTLPTLPDSFTVPLADFTKEPDKLTGIQQIGQADVTGSGEPLPGLIFYTHMLVVEACVKEVLPDLYRQASWATPCYVLVMETLDAINVENMPKEFYLLFPSDLCPDLDQFDSLLLSLQQEGVENYLLINQTTSTYEAFDNMFECFYPEDWGSVIAFSEGKLDQSLWDLPNWAGYNNWDSEFETIEKGEYMFFFPGGRNATLEACKEAIRQEISQHDSEQHKKVYCQADFKNPDIFAYTAPFANGVFEHSINGENIYFSQTINGIPTNVGFHLENGEIQDYDPPEYISKEVLSSVPDLGAILEVFSKDLYDLAPSLSEEQTNQGYVLEKAWTEAEYYTKDKKIYGIIKLVWKYQRPEHYNGVYHVRYYLVTQDGTCRLAAYEEIDRIKNPWKYE